MYRAPLAWSPEIPSVRQTIEQLTPERIRLIIRTQADVPRWRELIGMDGCEVRKDDRVYWVEASGRLWPCAVAYLSAFGEERAAILTPRPSFHSDPSGWSTRIVVPSRVDPSRFGEQAKSRLLGVPAPPDSTTRASW